MITNQIDALISLIEDPDEIIFSQVKSEIKNYGADVIPKLEKERETSSFGPLYIDRIDQLIQSIQLESISVKMKEWHASEEKDLLEGALLINQFQYPSYNPDLIRKEITRIRQDVWLELNDNLTGFEKVRIMNHILFNVHGFSGNKSNYTSPNNSFLGDVLSSKKGSPLSLAILYQVLANSLDIPIYGVNLPNHFILCYMDEHGIASMLDETVAENGILFYINPFSDGTVIHKNEIDEFLFHLNLPEKVKFYKPCDNSDIINRLINNLIFGFQEKGDELKVEGLRELQNVFARIKTNS
ncbi:MAG: transglutaminase-like domain-containing protein [Flavobacteriales bacterium]|mgnify:FL=1|jgi:regulator of sirC expression with transglutaminase-like and TPR domain|tara:strand:+ start:1240 stop:2133 length:894 start_codon:yes stop_codon:yes gene_type:complete